MPCKLKPLEPSCILLSSGLADPRAHDDRRKRIYLVTMWPSGRRSVVLFITFLEKFCKTLSISLNILNIVNKKVLLFFNALSGSQNDALSMRMDRVTVWDSSKL